MPLATAIQTWETDAGFAAADIDTGHVAGDVLRYRLVPNSANARTANSAALKKLLSASGRSRFQGRLRFPNASGSDIYHFDDFIEIKDGVHIDLQGCTLAFTKSYAPADDTRGFLMLVRDVTIENGAIDVRYDGRAGVNAGMALRVGSRNGYPFGSFTRGIQEETLARPMGNIVVRELGITTNNPQPAVLILGGLEDVRFENVHLDGQGRSTYGIYYEFGFWHHESRAAACQSSHARNLSLRNIYIRRMDAAAGLGMGIVGAMSANVQGLWVDGAFDGLDCRSGEALYYNVGKPYQGGKPRVVLENINCTHIGGTGIALTGAESAHASYLAPVIAALADGPRAAAQTDRLSFDLDSFSVDAGGFGLKISGPATVRNGSLHGASASGQLVLTDECVQFAVDSVRIVDSSNVGVRANFGLALYDPPRLKTGSFRNCLVAGNSGPGFAIGNSSSVSLEYCRMGYSARYDGADESRQTSGVNVAAARGAGVVCSGCYVTTAGGAVAYVNNGRRDNGCEIRNAGGTTTYTAGKWTVNGAPG
jgi:hypothetical protein